MKEVKQVITISEKAVTQLKELMQSQDAEVLGLRICVKSGGCSGLLYKLEYTRMKEEFDEVVSYKGVNVIIDSKALLYILGSVMDYVDGNFKSGFVFINPNEKNNCGCGKSFSI